MRQRVGRERTCTLVATSQAKPFRYRRSTYLCEFRSNAFHGPPQPHLKLAAHLQTNCTGASSAAISHGSAGREMCSVCVGSDDSCWVSSLKKKMIPPLVFHQRPGYHCRRKRKLIKQTQASVHLYSSADPAVDSAVDALKEESSSPCRVWGAPLSQAVPHLTQTRIVSSNRSSPPPGGDLWFLLKSSPPGGENPRYLEGSFLLRRYPVRCLFISFVLPLCPDFPIFFFWI